MSVLASDIKFYLTGGVANADPNASLGALTSTTQVSGALHGLFDAVAPDEATAGDSEYRAIDVKNTNVADTLYGAVAYITTETTSASTAIQIGLDATTQSVANESTAPAGVSFSAPTTRATGIALGDIAPAVTKRLWLKRVVTAGAGKLASDAGQVTVAGGTT